MPIWYFTSEMSYQFLLPRNVTLQHSSAILLLYVIHRKFIFLLAWAVFHRTALKLRITSTIFLPLQTVKFFNLPQHVPSAEANYEHWDSSRIKMLTLPCVCVRVKAVLESLSKRRFCKHARQPEVNRAVIANKQLDWLPVGVRVVINVACLSSLLSLWATSISLDFVLHKQILFVVQQVITVSKNRSKYWVFYVFRKCKEPL